MDSGRYELAIGVDRVLDDDIDDDEEALCRLKQQEERGEYSGLLYHCTIVPLYHVTTSKGCTAMVVEACLFSPDLIRAMSIQWGVLLRAAGDGRRTVG